ncbi:hypothetical protein, partial [Sphingobacterium sp.]|uniref:hypothetical protein n=1 Tax=Sphingobacterium sp. TaxID=341027 RepID=UPI002FDA0CC5
PFFTRKPLLETVKGFFRLNTSMAITLPPLTITAYPLYIVYRSTLKDSSYFTQELKVRYRYNTYRWEYAPLSCYKMMALKWFLA